MARWISRLQKRECSTWEEGLLDKQTLNYGIGGWLVPITVESDGSIPWQPAHQRLRKLPYALELQFQETLTPRQEQLLIVQLIPHVLSSHALQLNGRPVLLLKGLKRLASVQFTIRRWRHSCPNVLLLSGSDERDQLAPIEATELDGWVDAITNESNYLRHLKGAHHRLGKGGLEIPAVQALTPDQDQHCLNGSAELYREWLAQACAWSTVMHNRADDAPVVINSWEGHQRWGKQQPDRSTETKKPKRVPFTSLLLEKTTKEWGKASRNRLALLIHAFYPNKLERMLEPLANNQSDDRNTIDLYVSTPIEQFELVTHILEQQKWPNVKLFGVKNCGRDLVPFLLHLLPAAQSIGHQFFIKAHTKASLHLEEQSRKSWSQHLLSSLLTPCAIEAIQQEFKDHPSLGILAPAGCLMPMSMTVHINVDNLMELLSHSSIQGEWALQQNFIAGSMFAGRILAMESIAKHTIENLWSEEEQGQTDGTMSHAIERWLTLLPAQEGWSIGELKRNKAHNLPGFGYNGIK